MDRQLIVMFIIAVLCAAAGFFAGCAHISAQREQEQPPVWLSPMSVDAIADAVRERVRPRVTFVRSADAAAPPTVSDIAAAVDLTKLVTNPPADHEDPAFEVWLRGDYP